MLRLVKENILPTVTWLLYIISLINALNLPGPKVYIVTPAPKSVQMDEGRSAPFYYHNWIRRIDPPMNSSTTTTTTPKVETPDLIFAEFESDNGGTMRKSIRKLLEKEKIEVTTTTTAPYLMYDDKKESDIRLNGAPEVNFKSSKGHDDMNDYIAMYNNLYNSAPSPVYVSSTSPTASTTTSTTTTTAKSEVMDLENIWHIIDNEKYNQYSGKWEEQDINKNSDDDIVKNSSVQNSKEEADKFKDDNLGFPGFNSSPENGGENESRAIRTDPNLRFPYVNLKTFQLKRPLLMNNKNKKGNNIYTNLDNFQDVKYPVRGEAQDYVHNNSPIERYNSAQPYFPPDQQKNSKQSSSMSSRPMKTVANLVPPPPPPPPPPRTVDDYLPPPNNYESFPPYPPSQSVVPPPPVVKSPPPAKPPPPVYQPPMSDDDSDSPPNDGDDSDSPPSGYQYTPPPPALNFYPTLPPPPADKPFSGYTYDKPPASDDSAPMDVDNNPKYNYQKPSPMMPPEDHNPPGYSYDHGHHHPPHDTGDYPELVFDKHHGGPTDDPKGSDDMNHSNDMDMVPPPPPEMKPNVVSSLDHGFPHDFPGDFKYHDDDDFYHHHHHHHHTTTTTTTTETPRVNRYSYYYLGKKLYYIPLYFSAYFVAYVGALVIKAVLRHKIVYPNSFRPNDQSASFLSKRSVDSNVWDFSDEKLHEVTRLVTDALYTAAEKYMNTKK